MSNIAEAIGQQYLTMLENSIKQTFPNAKVSIGMNELTIRIPSDDVKKYLMNTFPDNIRMFVKVDTSDIIITFDARLLSMLVK